jgi:hypothetical protein
MQNSKSEWAPPDGLLFFTSAKSLHLGRFIVGWTKPIQVFFLFFCFFSFLKREVLQNSKKNIEKQKNAKPMLVS